jgi:peptidoglycan/xylan/chitin deacetylase (PgdA/CDA1 family)
VGELLRQDPQPAEALRQQGHEIGLHGDRHDNRIAYLDRPTITARLGSCKDVVRRFGIEGFRTPSLLGSPRLRAALGWAEFAYVSDIPDSEVDSLIAPRRGCASAFPFMRQGLLEIPLTLPLEDKLVLAGLDEAQIVALWRTKLEWARQVGGLAQLAVHNEPHLLRRCRGAYETLVRELAGDDSAWHATLGEVARWWKDSGRL